MNESVAGILFNSQDVLIGLRGDKGSMSNRWEFPGGKIEDGESEQDALCREFLEEFGASITVGEHVASAAFIHHGIERILKAFIVYSEQNPLEWILHEHTKLRWINVEEIPSLLFVDSDLKLVPELIKWIKNH